MAIAPQDRDDLQRQLATTALGRQRQAAEAARARTAEWADRPDARVAAPGFTNSDASAVAEFARTVDVVDWFVAHPDDRERIGALADIIADEGLKVLKIDDGSLRRLRFGDHLWCDIVAAFVQALEAIDAIPNRVAHWTGAMAANAWVAVVESAVHASRDSSHGLRPRPIPSAFSDSPTRSALDVEAGLEKEIVAVVVANVVRRILALASAGTLADTATWLRLLRVFTLLLCPDPSAHPVVWDHCLLPLLKSPLSSLVQRQLLASRKELLNPVTWDGVRRADNV